jgi:outer membrane protein assembly factor BamB
MGKGYTLAIIASGLASASLPSLRANPPPVPEEWMFVIGETSDSSPALASDGTIYFGTFSGKLWALTPEGARKWVFQAGREIRSSPAVGEDGTIYFGSRNRKLYALSPDGKKRWEFATGGWVDASAALSGEGTVLFGSWDKTFYAVGRDGVKHWDYRTEGPIVSSAAIDATGRIYFGSHDRKLYALNPEGRKAWDYATLGAIISSPAVDHENNVYFTSVDGFLYALKPDGTLTWRLQTGGITESSPVLGPGGLIYLGVNKSIWVVDANGEKKWERLSTYDDYERLMQATPAALGGGTILVLSGFSWLMEVNPNGPIEKSTLWLNFLRGHGHGSPALTTNAIICADGSWTNFFALKATNSLAQTPWPRFRANAQNTGRINPK